MEDTMNETLESVDKFQTELREANDSKLSLRIGQSLPKIKWPYCIAMSWNFRFKLRRPKSPLLELLSLRQNFKKQWPRVERCSYKAKAPLRRSSLSTFLQRTSPGSITFSLRSKTRMGGMKTG